MPREIAPGLTWVQEDGPDRSHFVADDPPSWYAAEEPMYVAQNAYLLDGGDETLLFDTLSPASTDRILDAVNESVDTLDYVVVSHTDVPHAGNAGALLEAHPEATLVAPRYGRGHGLYHLDDARFVGEGDRLDLGELTVDFHEAPFPDSPVHCWMSERETGTLFTVDWFGYPHAASESLAFADEFDRPVSVDRLAEFHSRVLFWFAYVDVPRVHRAIDRLAERHDPAMLAPAHGNPVRRDVDAAIERSKDVVEVVHDRGRRGALG